jgi:hypothetical protein
MTPPLRFGQIVWAEVADANGIRKARPVILLTPDERITPSEPLEVVAITSRLPQPLSDDHVLLPWHPRGHPRTGLTCKCAAVCTWLARILPSDIQNVAGLVPGPLMLTILSKIVALQPPPTMPPENVANDKEDNH